MITLAMIVRNESPRIERCIGSVLPYIDSWVICDTGSTDDTKEKIANALFDIPGKLIEEPWQNMGHNRSVLIREAEALTDGYILLLDADWTLHVDDSLPELTADAYFLKFNGGFSWRLPLLVRSGVSWHYVGRAQEYLDSPNPFTKANLDAWSIDNHSDGGWHATKGERVRDLLRLDLADRPNDTRVVFYLAQAERDLGNIPEAISLYRRRAEMGGWPEEAFYARFQQGWLMGSMSTLLQAWEMRPTRAEPLFYAAKLCEARGRQHLANLFYEQAAAIPLTTDILFVHAEAYTRP